MLQHCTHIKLVLYGMIRTARAIVSGRFRYITLSLTYKSYLKLSYFLKICLKLFVTSASSKDTAIPNLL